MAPRLLSAFGETRSLSEWARLVGINVTTINERVKAGWTPERALTEKPQRAERRLAVGDSERTLSQWANELGVPRQTLASRLRSLPPEKALRRGPLPRGRAGRLMQAFGEERTLTEWANLVGMKRVSLDCRLRAGMSPEDALTAPLAQGRRSKHAAAKRPVEALPRAKTTPRAKAPKPPRPIRSERQRVTVPAKPAATAIERGPCGAAR